jgi:hypothetical protein
MLVTDVSSIAGYMPPPIATSSRQRGLNRALIRSTTSAAPPVSVRVDARARPNSNEPADVPWDCLAYDSSARLGHSPDAARSDGVTS